MITKFLFCWPCISIYLLLLFLLLVLPLLPLALQPTVGFGLSNNVLPFFPISHQLSPSSHSQHLKISFYFLFTSLSSPSISFPLLSLQAFKRGWISQTISQFDSISLCQLFPDPLLYFLFVSLTSLFSFLDLFYLLSFYVLDKFPYYFFSSSVKWVSSCYSFLVWPLCILRQTILHFFLPSSHQVILSPPLLLYF